MPLYHGNRRGENGIGIEVGCDADGAVGVICSIVVIVERLHHDGAEQENDEEEREAFYHGFSGYESMKVNDSSTGCQGHSHRRG